MICQLRLGNLVNIVFLVVWFGHLVIPHEWVVPCLLIGDVLHQLSYNDLFPPYWVLLFYVYFLGSYEWYYQHKIWLIYHGYCSFSFTWHVIHFDSNIIWCSTSNYVCLSGFLLVTFSASFVCLSGATVDNVVSMWPAILLWINSGYILLPPPIFFFLKFFSGLSHVFCSMLNQACNSGCKVCVVLCSSSICINQLGDHILFWESF